LFLVVVQVDLLDVVAVDLEWAAVAEVTLLKFSMLTVDTLPLDLLSTLFVLVPPADVHVAVAAMVEELVVSMVVHRLFLVVG
jgi:hypothetical protein|tara:strand:- start:84 stop:329 length:246 start_codon:yes stop_codon:yes gene_type:complete